MTDRRRTDIIAEPGFAADPAGLDTATLRSRRQMCLDVERELSYQRRLLHGRLDLVDFEQRRRRHGGEAALESLGAILDDGPAATPRVAADTLATGPPPFDGPGRRPIDRVLADDAVSRLAELSDEELAAARDGIEEVEREISTQRRTVHAAEEALAAELARRYRSGTAAVDELIAD